MEIAITIDDTLIDDMCLHLKYQNTISKDIDGVPTLIPNPETKEALLQRKGEEHYQGLYEAGVNDRKTAVKNAEAKIEVASNVSKVAAT